MILGRRPPASSHERHWRSRAQNQWCRYVRFIPAPSFERPDGAARSDVPRTPASTPARGIAARAMAGTARSLSRSSMPALQGGLAARRWGRSPSCGRPSNGMTFVTARPSSSPDPIQCCRYGGRQRSAARLPPSGACSSFGFEAPASSAPASIVASSSPCRCSSGTTKPSTRSRNCMSSVMASSTADCS
jgi:hypothetical protein